MLYSVLMNAYVPEFFGEHGYLCKINSEKLEYTAKALDEGKKPHNALSFVEIVHKLKDVRKWITNSKVEREKMSKIIKYMRDQKLAHSLCRIFECIRNFFSRLQNWCKSYGFKTSVEIANDVLENLQEVPKASNIYSFLQQVEYSTYMIIGPNLEKIAQENNLNAPIAEDGDRLFHRLLLIPEHADPAWIGNMVQLGAEINIKNNHDETPLNRLMLASSSKGEASAHQLELVHQLVAHGADVTLPDKLNQTPLHQAITKELPFETVKLLITPKTAQYRDRYKRSVFDILKNRYKDKPETKERILAELAHYR